MEVLPDTQPAAWSVYIPLLRRERWRSPALRKNRATVRPIPLNRTVVPASCETILPLDGSTVPNTPAEGPSMTPPMTTSSPGATVPPVQLAAFTTALTTTGETGAALTVSTTEIVCGLFEADDEATVIAP